MNNPYDILSLMPRDVIADEHNNQYVVIAHLVDRLVVQHTCVISPNNAGKWKRCLPPTTAPNRPSCGKMHDDLIAADGLIIESKEGKKYKIRSRVFDTLSAAWDAIPEGRPDLFRMREQISKIGWKKSIEGGGVIWTGPGGVRFAGTLAAWNYVFGDA